MNDNGKISVIIPAYNAEKTIGKCLDSLFAQTYGNFEIIAVNDGSTDGTLDALNRYAASHTNMRVIDKRNEGPAVARNTALDLIKEKYTPRQLTYANAWEFLVVLEFTWYMRRLKDKDGYKRLKQRGESLKKDYYAVKKEYKLMRRMGGAAFRLI